MMSSRIILIRYDEIALKGKNRHVFIRHLRDNIRKKLKGLDRCKIETPHGRIFIQCEEGQSAEILRRLSWVPGIASISVGQNVEPDIDRMAELGEARVSPRLKDVESLRFCVRTRRSNKRFPMTSPEVDYQVGGRILEKLESHGLRVDLSNPELTLEIEIGQDRTVMFDSRIPGLRGLPVGSAGEALGLLSGGIDSPVALYRMIRRGCRVHGIFFDNQPFMGRGGYDKVGRLIRILNRFQDWGRLYVVPFEDIQVAIRDHCRPANRVVLYRRMMYRLAEAVAVKSGCQALITGESLGQVASQTLENLQAVSAVVTTSVFRPLIGMDKQEIIGHAKEIGTFETSIEPQPDCCSVFMPPNPATRARMDDLEDDETRYDWKALQEQVLSKMEVLEPEALPF